MSNDNNDKLQVLLPAITTNRELWTALGGTDLQPDKDPPYQPQPYSWVQYMTGKGYAVLAMDHLGQGKSSKPDPTKDVQAPYEPVPSLSYITWQLTKSEESNSFTPSRRNYAPLVTLSGSHFNILS